MTVTLATSGGEVDAQTFATRTFTPTEERILIAALGLIGRQGVQRLGMAQIADAAGVARGTLSR
jgi:AcrR family transcriptional regulator